LSDEVLEKFNIPAPRHSDELKDLGFKPGEIVDLKEAILEWAVSI